MVLCLGGPARADGIETAGEILRIALPLAGGVVALHRDDHEGLRQLAFSEAASLGTSLLLQSAIEKERPDGSDTNAFPSDSAAMAFAAASFLERRYGWDYGLPAYALAGFVAYSRVAADKHDWGDVAAGAVIGWAFGALLTTAHDGAIQVSGGPIAGDGHVPAGIRVHMAW